MMLTSSTVLWIQFRSLLYYRVSSPVSLMSSPSQNLVSSGPDKQITSRHKKNKSKIKCVIIDQNPTFNLCFFV